MHKGQIWCFLKECQPKLCFPAKKMSTDVLNLRGFSFLFHTVDLVTIHHLDTHRLSARTLKILLLFPKTLIRVAYGQNLRVILLQYVMFSLYLIAPWGETFSVIFFDCSLALFCFSWTHA